MKEITHVKVKPDMTINELLNEMRYGAGFGGRQLARAADVYEAMLKDDDATVFCGFAGALIPGGMRQVIIDMIEWGFIDVFVCTGAILTHDLIEAFGFHHYHGSAHVDDRELAKKNLNRIYNVLLPTSAYEELEENIQSILEDVKAESFCSADFLHEFGSRVPNENSILGKCARKDIPVFCPALVDSVFGFQLWMARQGQSKTIDAFNDHKRMLDIAHDSKKRGALIIGGGVPKHFIALAMQVTSKGLDYAVQITMDRPEPGGVSGASLEEAKSWKKVDPTSKHVVDVICDATIALPILVSAMQDRFKDGKRIPKKFEKYL
ncbi:MAG: deoxyhypusine synthase [Candidatus Helarchaeales archaeon]